MAKRPSNRSSGRSARKVAIVTGGGSGIGRACARKLAQDGYRVAIADINPERLKLGRGQIMRNYVCDVTDEASVKQTVKSALDDFGRIDVLINAAGVMLSVAVDKITKAHLDFAIGINLYGTIYFAAACVPALKKTKGAIVNISTSIAHRPVVLGSIYAASKGGVETFTKGLAVDLARYGIRANCVQPGVTWSNFLIATGVDEETFRKVYRQTAKAYPMGRVGEPEEIAELICFLASDRASYMTGDVIASDGGKAVG